MDSLLFEARLNEEVRTKRNPEEFDNAKTAFLFLTRPSSRGKSMRIGIDFDNTLVCYDQLFWKLAREKGLIDESIERRKNAVRDDLRRRGLEPRWTALQGEAYGGRILEALPFEGLFAGLTRLRQRGCSLFIVSHKTRFPVAGAEIDLHAAARSWLVQQGIWDPSNSGSLVQGVYFELTKLEKLQRIEQLGCDVFVDDLIELLMEPDFPTGVRRVLFDPHFEQTNLPPGIQQMKSWNDTRVVCHD